jgi:hypothetical protein
LNNDFFRDVISAANQSVAQGCFAEALAQLTPITSQTDAPNEALYLAAVCAKQLGQIEQAAQWFSRAAPQDSSGKAWLKAAGCWHELGQLQEEFAALSRCTQQAPTLAIAHGLLGKLAISMGEIEQAIESYLALHRLQPAEFSHLQQAVQLVAYQYSEKRAITDGAIASASPTFTQKTQPIDVITCSIDPNKQAALRRSLETHWGIDSFRLTVIHNARSLAGAFNGALAKATSEYVVLCHDDIEFIAPPAHSANWPALLTQHLQQFDVLGVAGTTQLTSPMLLGAGPAHAHGWTAHWDADEQPIVGFFSAHTQPVAAQALDGVFIAMRRNVFAQVQFDAQTFDGFHCYDVDFSYRCYLAGLRVAVCPDLWLLHQSQGAYSNVWRRYAQRMTSKFPELSATPVSPNFYGLTVPDMQAVREIYLALWGRLST